MTSVHCQDPHQAQLVFSAWADCQPVQMAQVWCDVPSAFGLLAMAEVSYCKYINSIPYHPSRCSIVLPCTTLRPVQCWPTVHARQNGKEEKGVYPGVSDAWLPPLCWHCMRVVYVRTEEPCAYCSMSQACTLGFFESCTAYSVGLSCYSKAGLH